MQKVRLIRLLLITSSALVASDATSDNEKSRILSSDLVATAALSSSPKNRDLPTLKASAKPRSTEHDSSLTEPKTPNKPYDLTVLQRALITPTVHDSPQAPAIPCSVRKPKRWYLETSSSDDEQWCPQHDRSETCYRCIWSYRRSY